VAAEPTEPSEAQDATRSLESRLAAVEAELAAMKEQQVTERPWEEEDLVEEFEPTLSVHGFFDLTFSYSDVPDNSPLLVYMMPYPTFLMSSVNVFVDAKPTKTFSTTVEIGFHFMPAGLYREPALYSSEGARLKDAKRDDPWIRDSATTALSFPGTTRIVRAQASYQPRDWFGITAGKFVTPYGIWNVEHAPTVVLPAHVPYLQVRQMMPLEQLGLQAFGRVFFGSSTYLDYAVTLSNGRANIVNTDIGDLDKNKALGLGLGLSYDSAGLLLKAGGYLYYGKLSDSEPRVTVNESGGFESAKMVQLSSYHELIAAFHVLTEYKGLRFQGELLTTRGTVIKPQQASVMDLALAAQDPTPGRYYQASWNGLGAYLLLAYTLPIALIEPIRIIPYAVYEYNKTRDTQPYFNVQYVAGGLTVRPQADLALKLEYVRFFLDKEIYKGDMSMYAAQIAVSF
jgi:hypothetical protein